MSKTVFPLEGSNVESAQFFLYDGIGRTVWGVCRVRREKNPDTLVVELGRGREPKVFSPFVKFTPVGQGMAFYIGPQFMAQVAKMMEEKSGTVRTNEQPPEAGKAE